MFDSTYVAGFAIRPFIDNSNCDVAAVLPILVLRSIPPTLNLNVSFVPSTLQFREWLTPPPTVVKSIALPPSVDDSEIVLASTYLI